MKRLYALNDLMNFNETFRKNVTCNKGYPKNHGFTFSLENTILEKPQEGAQIDPPRLLSVKLVVLKGISLFQM